MLRHICTLFSIVPILSGCIAASGPVVEEGEDEDAETLGIDQQALGALATPSLSFNKASYGINQYEFQWTEISGATRYRFQCDYDPFSGDYCTNDGCETEIVLLGQNNTFFSTMLFTAYFPSTQHRCRVRAGNDQQGSLWSATKYITTYP